MHGDRPSLSRKKEKNELKNKKGEENESIGYSSTKRRRKQTDACNSARLLHFRRSQRSTQGHGSIASELVPSAHGGHRPTGGDGHRSGEY